MHAPVSPSSSLHVAPCTPDAAEWRLHCRVRVVLLGARGPFKNSVSHIDASLSRQPLVKGERLVRYEVNAVMPLSGGHGQQGLAKRRGQMFLCLPATFWPIWAVPAETLRRTCIAAALGAGGLAMHPCGRGNDTTSDA